MDTHRALVFRTLFHHYCRLFFIWHRSPQWAKGLLIHEVSTSHSTTHHSR